MSFTLVVSGREDIDLGNTFDVIQAFATYGREPRRDFEYLHGLLQTNEEEITVDDLRRAQADARRFLDRHSAALDTVALDVLQRILEQTTGYGWR